MAGLILPNRRIVQPSDNFELDRSNPLTKGLDAAFVGGSLWEPVTRQLFSRNSNTGNLPELRAGMGGMAVYGTAASSYLRLPQFPTNRLSSTTGTWSALSAVVLSTDAIGDAVSVISWLNQFAARQGGYLLDIHGVSGGSVGQVRVTNGSSGGSFPGVEGVTPVPRGQIVHIGGTYNGVGGRTRVYIHGRIDAETTGVSAPTQAGTNPTLDIGASFQGDNSNANINNHRVLYSFCWNDRELSPAEVMSIRLNPWQLFKPNGSTKRIWIPISTAGTATFDSSISSRNSLSSDLLNQILLGANLINKNSLSGSIIGISASFAASLLNKNNVTADLSTSVRLASALANKNTITSALNASIAFAASLTNKNAITSVLNTSIALANQLNNYNLIISNLAGSGATFGSSLNNKNEIASNLLNAINLASSHNNYNLIVSALTTQAAGLTSNLTSRNLLVSDILTAVRFASSITSKNDITAAFGTNAALFSSNLQNYNLVSSVLSSLSISLSSSIQNKSNIQSNLQTLIKLASALSSKNDLQSQLGALSGSFASNLESKSKIESILQTAIRLSSLIESKNSITARFEVFDLGNSIRYTFVPNYSNLEYLGQEKDLALIMQALNLDFLMDE